MMILLVALAEALTLTIHTDIRVMTIRFPPNLGSWSEVCVYTMGKETNYTNRGIIISPWWSVSCWQPSRRSEEYRFPRTGALTTRARLVSENYPQGINTDPTNVRPITEEEQQQ